MSSGTGSASRTSGLPSDTVPTCSAISARCVDQIGYRGPGLGFIENIYDAASATSSAATASGRSTESVRTVPALAALDRYYARRCGRPRNNITCIYGNDSATCAAAPGTASGI